MERRPFCQLSLPFFGLTYETAPQHKHNLFTQINNIILYSEGRYDFVTLYNLPIHLRYMIFDELQKFLDKKNTPPNSSTTQTIINSDGTINKQAYEQLNLNKQWKPAVK